MMNRFMVAGVPVSAINMAMACDEIERRLAVGAGGYFIFRDMNGIVGANDDATLLEAHAKAGFVAPDGMPLVWIGRFLGLKHIGRVYGPDFMIELCARLEPTQYRHFLYGSTAEVLKKLAAELHQRFPGLNLCGQYSPPMRPTGGPPDEAGIERIRAADPHIVWVGLGTPKQEHWMQTHAARLPGMLLMGVGAAFDFHSKEKRQAPRWMQRCGLEWSYRLASEPRRLGRRYVIGIPRFLGMVATKGVVLPAGDVRL